MTAYRNSLQMLRGETGDWWKDDRKNWCAYCGKPMRQTAGRNLVPTGATRDHLIPKALDGGYLTIPACRECNVAKGPSELAAFLASVHFATVRKHKHRNQWPVSELWRAMAIAALRQADRHATASSTAGRTSQTKPATSLQAATP